MGVPEVGKESWPSALNFLPERPARTAEWQTGRLIVSDLPGSTFLPDLCSTGAWWGLRRRSEKGIAASGRHGFSRDRAWLETAVCSLKPPAAGAACGVPAVLKGAPFRRGGGVYLGVKVIERRVPWTAEPCF